MKRVMLTPFAQTVVSDIWTLWQDDDIGPWGPMIEDQPLIDVTMEIMSLAVVIAEAWENYAAKDKNRTLVYDEWLQTVITTCLHYQDGSVLLDRGRLPDPAL